MGYFVAYRHTGANPKRLEALLPRVCESLLQSTDSVYCTFLDKTAKDMPKDPKSKMEKAFTHINQLGGLFVVLDSDEKSEGMITEIGYCLAKGIPIVVAKRKNIDNTFIPSLAQISFEYSDVADLAQKILKMDNI